MKLPNHNITTILLPKDAHADLKKWCAENKTQLCRLIKSMLEEKTGIKMFRDKNITITP